MTHLPPKISVILATSLGYASIETTISHLSEQTIVGLIELLLVGPETALADIDEAALKAFNRLQRVTLPRFESVGSANAAGVRHAVAPVVALAEDHCFPDVDWAEQLVQAHRQDYAAVAPAFSNANPASAVSWADLFIGYGPWLAPRDSAELPFLPGHNSSYKRELLLGYGDQLEQMMEAETLLHWDLREKGCALKLHSPARVAHINYSLWRSWLPAQFYNGRLFAGLRQEGKSLPWQMLYVLGSPLIPLVRFWRIWRDIQSPLLRKHFFASAPAILVGLLTDGVGQLMGYIAGVGNARYKIAHYEVDRISHVSDQDKAALSSTTDIEFY